jgi:hypothetical protein
LQGLAVKILVFFSEIAAGCIFFGLAEGPSFFLAILWRMLARILTCKHSVVFVSPLFYFFFFRYICSYLGIKELACDFLGASAIGLFFLNEP